jgi:cobalt-zinc-cadmium efflux system outer membrane protein
MAAEKEFGLRKARLTLADLLNIPDTEAERLEVKDQTEERDPPLPTLEQLTRLAQIHRPDLRAYRLGLQRAWAEWLRAWVEQWPDLYVVARPNRPGRPDVGRGADVRLRESGLLVSLPDRDHYRGRIARAQINVAQSRIELERAERRVALDVRQANLEYQHRLAAVRRSSPEVVRTARQTLEDKSRQFRGGEVDIRDYLSAESEYREVINQHLRTASLHRRAALALNSAVGKRVLP